VFYVFRSLPASHLLYTSAGPSIDFVAGDRRAPNMVCGELRAFAAAIFFSSMLCFCTGTKANVNGSDRAEVSSPQLPTRCCCSALVRGVHHVVAFAKPQALCRRRGYARSWDEAVFSFLAVGLAVFWRQPFAPAHARLQFAEVFDQGSTFAPRCICTRVVAPRIRLRQAFFFLCDSVLHMSTFFASETWY